MPANKPAPMKQVDNLEDIARKAGVSRSTVSRVINNEPYVSPATRAKVLAVIEREGFVPNPAARMLVTQRARVIGVVIPNALPVVFDDPYYFPALLQGVAETTSSRDYATLLWWGQSEEEEQRLYKRILQQNRLMDGLILASASIDDPLVNRLIEMQTPFVMVERPASNAEHICYVTIDNVQAAQEAVAHLLHLGRRRIGTITGTLTNIDGQDRLQGYKNALHAAGIPFDPQLVVEGRFSRRSGFVGMQALVEQQVDAVFCGNDVTAIGALQYLQQIGLRVPEDVALVGFDDLPSAMQYTPHLTTVRQPVQQKGALATQLLLDLIEGSAQPPRQVLLPTQLIIRQSSGGIQP